MYPIFISTFITLITLFFDVRGKCVKPAYQYLVIFFLGAGVGYLLSPSLSHANLFERKTCIIDCQANCGVVYNPKIEKEKKTLKEIHKDYMYECKEKMDYHYDEACKCLKQAEEASLLLPNLSDKDKAYFCFTNILATLAPGTPTYRMIAAALAICGQYGSMVMAEWQMIDSRLHQAKHHFEMEEHYRFTGKYIQDQLNAEKK